MSEPEPELPELAGAPEPDRDIAERFGAGGWRFTREVAQVFDEHVRASVPNYDAIQGQIAECCDWLVPEGGLIADLGCSTGNTALAILSRHKDRGIRFALYDEQASMLAKARPAVEALAPGRVQSCLGRLEDGETWAHGGADLTVAAFVLQFLPWSSRETVLRRARDRAEPDGALIVAEKLRVPDARWAEIGTDSSHDYKAAAGISDTAIRAKARALRGVLRPATLDGTAGLIVAAGWTPPEVLFRWHQWAVLGAFAGE